jgi:ribonuclease T2
MPGTQSLLERHEWIKHGTCYGGLAEEAYFGKALALADEVNASAVQSLFAGKRGQTVTSKEIRAAFDAAFGAGTGERVSISCNNDGSRRLIAEIRIGLAGPDGNLATMTKAAKPADADCESGIVDTAALE